MQGTWKAVLASSRPPHLSGLRHPQAGLDGAPGGPGHARESLPALQSPFHEACGAPGTGPGATPGLTSPLWGHGGPSIM